MKSLASVVRLNFGKRWINKGLSYCCGDAFIGQNLIKASGLIRYLEKQDDSQKLKTLTEASGFFSIAILSQSRLFASVDSVRSIPLFYSMNYGTFFLSDNPYWIAEQIGESESEKAASYELLLTRYVTGPNTLHPGIKQLQAGEALMLQNDKNNKPYITTFRYFSYTHPYYLGDKKHELLKKHDAVLIASFKRFIRWADNRPVVIPLSGGYDSRLVAVMLKRLGYKNIITFSFGKPENPEAIVSQQVAKHLGLSWHFVPYDSKLMYEWTNSLEWIDFNYMADGMTAACLDREWPAVWELKKQGIIPENAVFVPGHSGDFTCGGHLPVIFKSRKCLSEDEFTYFIFKIFYTMLNWQGVREKLKPYLAERILLSVKEENSDKNKYSAGDFEKWVWQEWQSKYIINGVRVYEFWGHKWWLPLWDKEYINFWRTVPVKWKIQKRLYRESVAILYSEIAGISRNEAILRNDTPDWLTSLLQGLRTQIVKSPLRPLAKSIKKTLTSETLSLPQNETPEEDWEQCLGRLNKTAYDKLLPYLTCRSSCVTLEKLGYIRFSDQDVSDNVIEFLKKLKGKDA